MEKIIHVKSIKKNGFVNYEWDLSLIEKNNKYLIGLGEVNRKLIHHGKNKIFTFENPSVEFYSREDWFTLSIEKTKENDFNYYCNICMPSILNGNTLSFVDLDLDVVKTPGTDWVVIDEDEFEINMKKYKYSEWLIEQTIKEKELLLEKIKNKVFPFDDSIKNIIDTKYIF